MKLAEWRAWLGANHAKEQEAWAVYFKPGNGVKGISYDESVEEALCFGWVDSIVQKIDVERYGRKFNPRRMESAWSESNRRIVKLIGKGRMTSAGMAKVTFEVESVEANAPMPRRQPVELPEAIEKALKAICRSGRRSRKSRHRTGATTFCGWRMPKSRRLFRNGCSC